MRLNSHSVEFEPLPLVTKSLFSINVALFLLELILYLLAQIDLVSMYCLSPAKIINEIQTSSYTINGVSSLFLSNLFHLNPITSNIIMGVMHIMMNMMVLLSTGKWLEKQFGSVTFGTLSIFFLFIIGPLQIPLAILLETITMNKIGLLSTNQCGVGYSGVLFAYFMLYLNMIPNERVMFCGFQVKKWVVPFLELLMLSIFLHASFIGHLSGIIVGLLYITGIPGCFQSRQAMIKYIENKFCFKCISNRKDFISTPSSPKINKFKPSISCLVTKRNTRTRTSSMNSSNSGHPVALDEISDTSDDTVGINDDETDGLI